ncbi:winged helix-turn-helix domain-containing protein [Halobellus sp. EA9]|uniref:winged helix-turn-helix domain-containing protein n=1 Tax=Halobellus sp. EA9 TaxID=3421647 RepID=UPI003EB975BE
MSHLNILQQILAHDSGVLSIEELNYRNTDVEENTIRESLHSLDEENLVTPLSVAGGDPDLPDTYWAVTPEGVEFLKQNGVYDEIAVLSEADDALERSQRIKRIEAAGNRPDPGWF